MTKDGPLGRLARQPGGTELKRTARLVIVVAIGLLRAELGAPVVVIVVLHPRKRLERLYERLGSCSDLRASVRLCRLGNSAADRLVAAEGGESWPHRW